MRFIVAALALLTTCFCVSCSSATDKEQEIIDIKRPSLSDEEQSAVIPVWIYGDYSGGIEVYVHKYNDRLGISWKRSPAAGERTAYSVITNVKQSESDGLIKGVHAWTFDVEYIVTMTVSEGLNGHLNLTFEAYPRGYGIAPAIGETQVITVDPERLDRAYKPVFFRSTRIPKDQPKTAKASN